MGRNGYGQGPTATMRRPAALSALALLMVAGALCDVYLHNPRGSNNRNDNTNDAVQNAERNRLFDSQNNDQGGYLSGSMYYYSGSTIMVEWTNQHSCNNQYNQCQLIFQYMCDNMEGTSNPIRDGTVAGAGTVKVELAANPTVSQVATARSQSKDLRWGVHESFESYYQCSVRSRNKGLFISTQTLNNNQARARNTRQNNAGTQYGFECPEERDYYPYWHYSEWVDVAVMTSNTDRCDYYKANSGNIAPKNMCSDPTYNNQAECVSVGSTWGMTDHQVARLKKTIPEGEPECIAPPTTRINHLGNTASGEASMYEWKLPEVEAYQTNCVARLRYNISTTDYNDWDSVVTNTVATGGSANTLNIAAQPQYANKYVSSSETTYLLTNDPSVDLGLTTFGAGTSKLKLNVQTNQFGRTFEDRTHRFAIKKRDEAIVTKIHNINVRGRRGNIVQAYPSVEYDFTPNHAKVEPGEYVHYQWTGSNKWPDTNDGEGLQGSDRSNIVQLEDKSFNQAISDADMTIVTSGRLRHFAYNSYEAPITIQSNTRTLDDSTPYYDGGLHPTDETQLGTYHYMSTRNNNFSNRSQKATLEIGYFGDKTNSGLTVLQIVLIAVFVPLGSCMVFVTVGGTCLLLWIWQPKRMEALVRRIKHALNSWDFWQCTPKYDPFDKEKGLYTLASPPEAAGVGSTELGLVSRFEKK